MLRTLGPALKRAGGGNLSWPGCRALSNTQNKTPTGGDPAEVTDREKRMRALLTEQLKPTILNIMDVSGGCGAMYQVEVESPVFAGKSLVAQHRMVNQILAKEISEIHGMGLQTRAPTGSK